MSIRNKIEAIAEKAVLFPELKHCRDCICFECFYNAENDTDGLCRNCEVCRNNDYEFNTSYCDQYKTDNKEKEIKELKNKIQELEERLNENIGAAKMWERRYYNLAAGKLDVTYDYIRELVRADNGW